MSWVPTLRRSKEEPSGATRQGKAIPASNHKILKIDQPRLLAVY
jgi:hypothetical protein